MDLERIATLAASGLPASSIATIVGLSPARIAQIQKQEDYMEIFQVKQIEVGAKDIEEVSLSAKYTSVEHLLLEQMVQMAPVSELRDVTAALRVVAERQEKAKSRMNPIIQKAPVYNNIVQLTIPAHALPELQLSGEKEIIAIGNQNLTPLSSKGVLGLFKQLGAEPQQQPQQQLSDAGDANHDTARALTDAEASASQAISTQVLTDGARKFLDSLHPAPFAASY